MCCYCSSGIGDKPKATASVNHHHNSRAQSPRTKHELKRQRSQHRLMQKKMMQVSNVAPFIALHIQDQNSKTSLGCI